MGRSVSRQQAPGKCTARQVDAVIREVNERNAAAAVQRMQHLIASVAHSLGHAMSHRSFQIRNRQLLVLQAGQQARAVEARTSPERADAVAGMLCCPGVPIARCCRLPRPRSRRLLSCFGFGVSTMPAERCGAVLPDARLMPPPVRWLWLRRLPAALPARCPAAAAGAGASCGVTPVSCVPAGDAAAHRARGRDGKWALHVAARTMACHGDACSAHKFGASWTMLHRLCAVHWQARRATPCTPVCHAHGVGHCCAEVVPT